MPPPTKETRFREVSVLPWLHYIPLGEEFTDLIEKIQFCDNHISICQKVVEMASTHPEAVEVTYPFPEEMIFVYCQHEACVFDKSHSEINDPYIPEWE